jgi:hypothetical protein
VLLEKLVKCSICGEVLDPFFGNYRHPVGRCCDIRAVNGLTTAGSFSGTFS